MVNGGFIMKKIQNETNPKAVQARRLFDNLMDAYDLTENQLDEAERLFNEKDVDGLKAFKSRIEKLNALQVPQKIKAVKLSLTDFDTVQVGNVLKFNYTNKAIKNLIKNNIQCAIAYSDAVTPADKIDFENSKDTAIITEKTNDFIIAISQKSGIEYALTPDDFNGIVNGKQYKSCHCCMFGILPFTAYTAAAEEKKK